MWGLLFNYILENNEIKRKQDYNRDKQKNIYRVVHFFVLCKNTRTKFLPSLTLGKGKVGDLGTIFFLNSPEIYFFEGPPP